jgi:SAM-dependent methyltransferase
MNLNTFKISDNTIKLLLKKWKGSPESFLFYKHDEKEVITHFYDSLNKERLKIGLELLKEYTVTTGKRIFEIGAGYGGIAALSKEYKFEYTGVEYAKDIYDVGLSFLADNEISSDNYHHGDGSKTGFPNETFDIVFSINVLEHVKSIEEIILEAIRVVKKGGYVIFSFPNYNSFFEGHAGIFWIPYLSNLNPYFYYRIGGIKKNFALHLCKTQNFVTLYLIKRILKKIKIKDRNFCAIEFGEKTFKKRLQNYREMKCWNCHNLKKLESVIKYVDRLKLLPLFSWFVSVTETHTPIVLVLQKV